MASGKYSRKSPYHRNEDRAAVSKLTLPKKARTVGQHLLAVACDGHGGSRCAEYVHKNLARVSSSNLKEILAGNLLDVLRLGFEAVTKNWASQAKRRREQSGACAAAILMCGDQMVAANIGDCRVAVRRADGCDQQLTYDHRAKDKEEKQRVIASGGFVRNGRLFGVLEPSRSIGDMDIHEMYPGKGLIATPSLGAHRIMPGRLRTVIVVATDGVWDVLPTSQALSIVTKLVDQGKPCASAARALCDAAASAGSLDDITAVVVCVDTRNGSQ